MPGRASAGFGAGDGEQVWFRIDEDAIGRMPEKTPTARGDRLVDALIVWIANARTRAAYGRAVGQFLAWCEARGLGLAAVSPLHVAAYIRTHPGSAPTVKQHLAAR